ncbi:TonB-dependent receptor [Aquabacterium sp.]|uniref:TonB-dependent receptor n=1 Tax=Aquabacterium sp. TaxID=1872578 RepID=UPI002C181D13|nr:TonB-dependent receptor [Aquabacterium sp.]HSW06978.1 TonB-dependent receptor [Aquabacterium sp.]
MIRTMPRWRHAPLALAGLMAVAATGAAAQSQGAPTTSLPQVEVVGVTPVPGTGVAKDQIPSNVQTANDKRLRQLQSLNLPDFMSSQLPSVNVNEIQGNPFQMDVNFRGFSASPLLGTPQGLSVYQDGVRINEPFGDVVNWDLIPKAALAHITLLPGSNPLFGLNTLGGALSLQTKSGDTHPGTEVEVQAGSFKRVSTELSHGRRLGESGHLFLAASSFDEDGWRDHSPSQLRQFFAKAGQHTDSVSWELALTHGRNRMIGNGLLPESMLEHRREQVYTRPDQTENTMTLLSLNASVDLSPRHRVSATLYTRHARAATLNGDLNDDYDPPDDEASGVENRTRTQQRGQGVTIQSNWTGEQHRLTLGASHDRARSRFMQTEAEGLLDATRAVIPEDEPEVDALISGRSRTTSVFVHDLIALQHNLQLTLSGRFNSTRVSTVDEGRLTLGLPTTLDGEGRYRKFNPAAGLTWQLTPSLTAYASMSQGNRAPSPIELGCSDPDKACVLPNALQSDPPLKQVVSRTVEAGARGSLTPQLRWNASVFRTTNRDDLLFISNGRAAGYFTNFGRTRRQGVELSLVQQNGAFNWSASYSFLRASFESSACIVAEGNSSAETSAACTGDDEIEVRPGNRLPGLPEHSLKLGVDWKPAATWGVGAQLRAFSGQTLRGNENNAHQADGDEFFGAGRIGGFAVLDLTGSWQLGSGVELFAKLSNAFNRRYASAGLLGENAFDAGGTLQAPDDWRHERFLAPGAPRALWLGARLRF